MYGGKIKPWSPWHCHFHYVWEGYRTIKRGKPRKSVKLPGPAIIINHFNHKIISHAHNNYVSNYLVPFLKEAKSKQRAWLKEHQLLLQVVRVLQRSEQRAETSKEPKEMSCQRQPVSRWASGRRRSERADTPMLPDDFTDLRWAKADQQMCFQLWMKVLTKQTRSMEIWISALLWTSEVPFYS